MRSGCCASPNLVQRLKGRSHPQHLRRLRCPEQGRYGLVNREPAPGRDDQGGPGDAEAITNNPAAGDLEPVVQSAHTCQQDQQPSGIRPGQALSGSRNSRAWR